MIPAASWQTDTIRRPATESHDHGQRLPVPPEIKTVSFVVEIGLGLSATPFVKPILEDARTKMASRDFALRDVYHDNIAEYLRAVSPEEYDKFIGSQSVDFDRLLEENKDVLERLKQ